MGRHYRVSSGILDVIDDAARLQHYGRFAFGFISYAFLKLVTGKGKQVHWLIYLFAILFVIRYIWLVG